jgi:hypothetical protein
LHGAIAQSFYNFAKSFFNATLLSHFPLLIAQSFLLLQWLYILLQYSGIFNELSHSSYYSTQPFFIEQSHSFAKWLSWTDGGAHSFARRRGRTRWLMRAVDGSRLRRGGHAARARGARLRHGLVRGDVRVDHARGAGKRGRLAWSDYA